MTDDQVRPRKSLSRSSKVRLGIGANLAVLCSSSQARNNGGGKDAGEPVDFAQRQTFSPTGKIGLMPGGVA